MAHSSYMQQNLPAPEENPINGHVEDNGVPPRPSPSRSVMTMLRRAGRNQSSSSAQAASVTPEDQLTGRRRPPAAPSSVAREDILRTERSSSFTSTSNPEVASTPRTSQFASAMKGAQSVLSGRRQNSEGSSMVAPDGRPPGNDPAAHHRRTVSMPPERPLNDSAGLNRQRSIKRGSWFNPETLANQKREWGQQFKDKSKVVDWPEHNFEHFIVVGLPPTTLVKAPTADDVTRRRGRADGVDAVPEMSAGSEHRGSHGEPLAPQILYSFPPDKPLSPEVVSFCFPHDVQPSLLERTPSMSALNELIYSQQYQHDDAVSFVFLLKAADNLPLYGVCCYMEEMVHRPPAILSDLWPQCSTPLSRYLVAAPRCYCLLTHFPFFTLHMKVLHMMMGLERIERMRMFAAELTATASPAPRASRLTGSGRTPPRRIVETPAAEPPQETGLQGRSRQSTRAGSASSQDGVESADGRQRLEEALDHAERPAAASNQPKDEQPSGTTADYADLTARLRQTTLSGGQPLTPGSIAGSGESTSKRSSAEGAVSVADIQRSISGFESQLRAGTMRRTISGGQDAAKANAEALKRASARLRGTLEDPRGDARSADGGASPDEPEDATTARPPLDMRRAASEDSQLPLPSASAAEDARPAPDAARTVDASSPDAAKALKVMHSYYTASVPEPGRPWELQPDGGLQAVQYSRPRLSEHLASTSLTRVAISTAEAEAADQLATWTVATLCRSLSLPNILTVLTAVLLERQVVIFCPNIGVLTSSVLALIPLVRPYAWQSLLLPVLPATEQMLDFLQAPVPFIVGVQYKTDEVRALCGGLVRVNMYKDQVKNAATLPALPNDKTLLQFLQPSFNVLSNIGRRQAHGQPLYAVGGIQRTAAEGFLTTMRSYLAGLTSNLAKHTITDVQNADRVSLLLKDSFIESFAPKERPFVRQFVETQLFSEHVDKTI